MTNFPFKRNPFVGTSTGSSSAYAITIEGEYGFTGQRLQFKANHASTGASTLSINGSTAVALKKNNDVALAAGDIESGQIVDVQFDGTEWEVLNPSGVTKVPTSSLTGEVAVYSGKVTWSGGLATLASTVTGVAATDRVVATIQTAPTQAAYIASAAPTTNTITFTLSAANTSNDAVISYVVFRTLS